MKIFINAGHGGNDPGAVSENGTKEADITRNVCSKLVYKLIKNGYNVEFFQQEKSFTEISKIENSSISDLFISIHCNAATNKNANGIEVYYYPTSTKGKKCAQYIQNQLVLSTKLKDRGIKAKNNLHVLKHTKTTAILIELAFISNTKEEKLLIKKSAMFADAILQGINELNFNKLI